MSEKAVVSLNTFVMPSTGSMLRELISAWGYGQDLSDEQKRAIGKSIAEFIGREKYYSREYITNILAGRVDSEAFRKAVMQLLTIASGEARAEQVKGKQVEVIALGKVHPGALVLGDSIQCICGLHFIPKTWNQTSHNKACAKVAQKLKRAGKKA